MRIAELTGFNYKTLINGDYKILLEPIAYMTFNGMKMAMTATEAALYDQQLGGGLRSKMVSLSHKNLPLAMFLETPDLGYPAWAGSTTTAASNTDIISSLGLGIVRFSEAEPPQVSNYDYTYRVIPRSLLRSRSAEARLIPTILYRYALPSEAKPTR